MLHAERKPAERLGGVRTDFAALKPHNGGIGKRVEQMQGYASGNRERSVAAREGPMSKFMHLLKRAAVFLPNKFRAYFKYCNACASDKKTVEDMRVW
jgi:hypothetical protein